MGELTYDGTLFDSNCEKSMLNMKTLKDIENDIIPKNSNLIKIRNSSAKIKKPKKVAVNKTSDEVTVYNYVGNIDPFLNSTHFLNYYRSVLSYLSSSNEAFIRFPSYSEDTPYAAKILDIMAEHSRKNKIFLNSWIKFFYDFKLKGDKSIKIKYTTLHEFMKTFDEYNSKHIEV